MPFAEDDEVDQPITPYATTKRAGELLCFNYHHLYGLRTSCLRFFTVYGPASGRRWRSTSSPTSWRAARRVPLYGDGSTRRDYTYIDDIVDGVVAALDLAPGFEIFNLGGAETTTLARPGALDRRGAGRRAAHRAPARAARRRARSPTPTSTKARRMLGYSPKVPIREACAASSPGIATSDRDDAVKTRPLG